MPIDFTNVSILKVNNFSYFSQTERKEVFHLFTNVFFWTYTIMNGVVGTCKECVRYILSVSKADSECRQSYD